MRRTCIECGTPILSGSRCQAHTYRNGSGTGWRKLREQILTRDNRTCSCGAYATHVDHVTPLARGGTDHPSNLQAMCQDCNLTKGTA